jgi:hypothetical protein
MHGRGQRFESPNSHRSDSLMRLLETARLVAERNPKVSLAISQLVQILAGDSGVRGDLSTSTTDRTAMSMVMPAFGLADSLCKPSYGGMASSSLVGPRLPGLQLLPWGSSRWQCRPLAQEAKKRNSLNRKEEHEPTHSDSGQRDGRSQPRG